MSDFKVTTEDLHSLAAQLSALVAELGQAGQIRPDIGAAGHPRVEASLHAFFAEWSDGVHRVQGDLSRFSERLSGAGRGYETTEHAVMHDFDKR